MRGGGSVGEEDVQRVVQTVELGWVWVVKLGSIQWTGVSESVVKREEGKKGTDRLESGSGMCWGGRGR